MALFFLDFHLRRGLSARVVATDIIHVSVAAFMRERTPSPSHQTDLRGGLFQVRNTGGLPVDLNAGKTSRFSAEKRRSIW
jgi:hypothetical protein